MLIAFLYACQVPLGALDQVDPQSDSEKSFSLNDLLDFQLSATSTPTPETRMAEADKALFSGELERAAQLYRENFESQLNEDDRARALYGLGRTYHTDRDYVSAIDAFNRILGQFPDASVLPETYFMLGESYFEQGELEQASTAYAKYAGDKNGPLDWFALRRAGDAALAAGKYEDAIFVYQEALSEEYFEDEDYLNLQIGKAYEGLGDLTTAIQYYLNVYTVSEDDATKATANLLAGQAYLQNGQDEEAYKRFMDSVFQFPTAYDSFTALSILVDNNVPVDEFNRGLVDYYVGSYQAAVEAFDRYLAANPDNNDGTAYYFRGDSHFALGNHQEAINDFDTLINGYRGNFYWAQAWGKKSLVQQTVNEYARAAETYLGFVSAAPEAPEAADYLFRAGRSYEIAGNLEEAAAVWQRTIDEYPSGDLSYRGLFMAGISYYRLERFEDALSVFQRNLVLGASPDDRARAYLWIGKCFESLGQTEDARNAWELGKNADPTDYYSIRNAQLLEGEDLYQPKNNFDLGYDLSLEKEEAEEWLVQTFNLLPETDFYSMAELENNPHYRRMMDYWLLGYYSSAVNEAEQLRVELRDAVDIVNSYKLMNLLVDLHLYQSAIYTSRYNILDLAGMDDLGSLGAPILFTHVRYGAYFRELLVPIANEYGLHPLILYSLIRQESLFNPYIGSSAGAIGLAQIIPSTAQDIKSTLQWPADYEVTDLYRAEVNLSYGAFYLSTNTTALSGNIQAALAAYNAGQGNAVRWFELSNGDADLFFEIVRFLETQTYLMHIAEFLNVYELVYSRDF